MPPLFCRFVGTILDFQKSAMSRDAASVLVLLSCYTKPAERADLQISLGKTRHVSPNCVFTLEDRMVMTSHVAAKEHVTP